MEVTLLSAALRLLIAILEVAVEPTPITPVTPGTQQVQVYDAPIDTPVMRCACDLKLF